MEDKIFNRLILINLVLYVLGWFIFCEVNPSKWIIFENWFGRLLFVLIEYFMIVQFPSLLKKLKK